MSRRAVLRALGISPVILSLASVETRAEAKQQTTDLVNALWTPSLTSDLDTVVGKGKAFYKTMHQDNDWSPEDETKYRNLARNLFSFYVAGIEFESTRQGKSTLVPPVGFMVSAWKHGVSDTGEKLVVNLPGFTGDHGPLDVETEICAWRCGKAAAEAEIANGKNMKFVSLESYVIAWNAVKADVDALRQQLSKSGGVHTMNFGGGC
jgi:hypothetical protein